MNNENVIKLTIDYETNNNLERYSDMIDRRCSDIARLISKDTSFNNEKVQKIYQELCTLEAEYSTAKEEISNTLARPAAIEKWGETAVVNWVIDFASRILSITYNGSDNRETVDTGIVMEEAFVNEQRDLSIKRTALSDIYDRIIQTSPSIDNQAFVEFAKHYDQVEDTYVNNTKIIDREHVRLWFDENKPEAPMNTRTWSLDFATRMIKVSYSE